MYKGKEFFFFFGHDAPGIFFLSLQNSDTSNLDRLSDTRGVFFIPLCVLNHSVVVPL